MKILCKLFGHKFPDEENKNKVGDTITCKRCGYSMKLYHIQYEGQGWSQSYFAWEETDNRIRIK